MSGGFSLLPKNLSYFDDFDEAIGFARALVRTVREAADAGRFQADLTTRTKQLEKEADQIVRRCLARLDESFVTPIEREDIHTLIVEIDDISDKIEGCASRLDIYGISEPTPELKHMLALVDEMAERLGVAVKAIRTLDGEAIRNEVLRINELEERVDVLYRETLRGLFARRPEAYDLVRWKDIYDTVEDAADHCRYVGRTVNHILVRHS
ncbi:MAG TPA: DUF47 family protein [Myxococcota bacterium]|nr:DUF47 family protein [Myxococcota bacterium]